jgi:hypothetical protein
MPENDRRDLIRCLKVKDLFLLQQTFYLGQDICLKKFNMEM